MNQVLLIEDEISVRLATAQSLKLADIEVTAVATAEEALPWLRSDFVGVVVSDVRLPGRSGLDVLALAMQADRDIPVILFTGHGDIAMAVDAMRQGAYDFVEKPFYPDHLVAVVRRALEKRRLVLDNRALQQAVRDKDAVPALIGQSVGIERLRQFIATIGPTRADVLINGETGTGKEVMARQLHAAGSAHAPFVALNCAAMPEAMFESEVFGHEAGAFTGATRRRIGKFEHARGGTVFLDEIESMPLQLQVKLLRVLQERTLERLGGNASIAIDCRVIAASKVDLVQLSAAGSFRADLYYRIATVSVELPPLRAHANDIPLLLTHFVQQASLRYQRPMPDWSPSRMDAWRAMPWPGNVRELKSFAERLVLGVAQLQDASADTHAALPLSKRLELVEKTMLDDALASAAGNVALAAERLGIAKTTLYDKLKRYER